VRPLTLNPYWLGVRPIAACVTRNGLLAYGCTNAEVSVYEVQVASGPDWWSKASGMEGRHGWVYMQTDRRSGC
jgi:hypothetical protein